MLTSVGKNCFAGQKDTRASYEFQINQVGDLNKKELLPKDIDFMYLKKAKRWFADLDFNQVEELSSCNEIPLRG